MSRQAVQYNVKRRRGRMVLKRKMTILLTMLLLVIIGSVIFGSIFSAAQTSEKESEAVYKYYKSIQIEKGDSLWSIAKEYRTDAYDSTKEYVDELMEINNLTSDKIQCGQYLIVSYYDSEFK